MWIYFRQDQSVGPIDQQMDISFAWASLIAQLKTKNWKSDKNLVMARCESALIYVIKRQGRLFYFQWLQVGLWVQICSLSIFTIMKINVLLLYCRCAVLSFSVSSSVMHSLSVTCYTIGWDMTSSMARLCGVLEENTLITKQVSASWGYNKSHMKKSLSDVFSL